MISKKRITSIRHLAIEASKVLTSENYKNMSGRIINNRLTLIRAGALDFYAGVGNAKMFLVIVRPKFMMPKRQW